jgi:hypothetical protein
LPNESDFENWMQAINDRDGVSLIGAAENDRRRGTLVEASWRSKLTNALQNPLDAASLADMVYPGDCVAISVGPDVPGSEALVETLVELLVTQGVRHADITILGGTNLFAAAEPHLAAPVENQGLENQVRLVAHRADDQEALAMVGVSRHNFPIYLNKHLVEADVVIPLVLMNRDEGLSLAGSIYPTWSSVETQERLRGHQAEQIEEAKEAENLVCPFLMIGVIPSPGGAQGEVVAGLRQAVQHQAKQRLKALWTTAPAAHAAVLATLEAHYDLGLWDRLRHALHNALALAADQAPIVLLLAPGVAGSRQSRTGGKKRSTEKSRLMEIIEEATRHRPIFLASDLDTNEVEELGLGAIATSAELRKLLQRSPELAVIRDADRWRIHE